MNDVTTEATSDPFSPGLRRAIGVVMIGASLSFLDTTIVNVAVHSLSVDLHAGLGTVQWVVTAYLLALAAVIPVTGWAARRFGAARLYVAALVVFTLGSVLCACSTSVGMLIASRALQGIAGIALALRLLPMEKGSRDVGRLDALGLILASAGIVGITYGLAELGVADRLDIAALIALLVGLVTLAGFVAHGLRADRPLLDVRLYSNRGFTAAAIATFALGAANYGGMILMPLYLQVVRGEGVIIAGLLVEPTAIGALLSAPFTDRYGAGITSLTGAMILAVATIPFLFLTTTTSYWWLCIVMVARGVGFGLSIIPVMTAAYQALRPDQIPDATPQLNVLQRVGGAIGTAVLTVVLTSQLHDQTAPSAQASGFATTFWWVLAITIVATIPTIVLSHTEHQARRIATAPKPVHAAGTGD